MPDSAANIVETHSAVVISIGDRVYKLKKPVNLGFLDFSTVEARRMACHREVELNRRLAPDVYLGVADVVGPDGELCDHLVVMRRMPADRRLTACIERGEDVDDALRQVAHDVAALHASSPATISFAHVATAEAVRSTWDASFEQMAPDVGPVLSSATAARVEYLVHRYLDGRDELFKRRIDEGWVRDGHGDLQADDIFLLPDGPRVLDCIEFSDELRWGDALSDVAFLAMDLERLGRKDLAERFLAWHREFSADGWPSSLAHHYIAHRAHVRAKVTAIRHNQGDPSAKGLANRFLDLACAHLEQARVKLILVGGLPGTGKSTLAAAIGEKLPVVVLRSDEMRTQATTPHGRPGSAPYGEGRYRPEAVAANYCELIRRAAELLALGESVVLDASWSSDNTRARTGNGGVDVERPRGDHVPHTSRHGCRTHSYAPPARRRPVRSDAGRRGSHGLTLRSMAASRRDRDRLRSRRISRRRSPRHGGRPKLRRRWLASGCTGTSSRVSEPRPSGTTRGPDSGG